MLEGGWLAKYTSPREGDHPVALKKAAPMLPTCTQWDLPSPQMHHASLGALSRRAPPGEGNQGHRVSRGVGVFPNGSPSPLTLAGHFPPGWCTKSEGPPSLWILSSTRCLLRTAVVASSSCWREESPCRRRCWIAKTLISSCGARARRSRRPS